VKHTAKLGHSEELSAEQIMCEQLTKISEYRWHLAQGAITGDHSGLENQQTSPDEVTKPNIRVIIEVQRLL
jgi:hypothetical protein